MTQLRDHHATIFLPPHVAEPIEAVRRKWDPGMAQQIAAHVTLVYPQEIPDGNELALLLGAVCPASSPFRLRCEAPFFVGRPEDGVCISVDDVEGGFRSLRDSLPSPSFQPIVFPPHVTLVHPRTSSRGRELWDSASAHVSPETFTVDEVSITAFNGATWVTLETFELGGSRSPKSTQD